VGPQLLHLACQGGGSLPDPRQLCRYRPCINKKLFSTKCGYLEEWKGHHRSVEAEEKQCTNFNMLNSLAGVINNINVMQPGNLEKVVHPCLSMCTPACLCAPLPVYVHPCLSMCTPACLYQENNVNWKFLRMEHQCCKRWECVQTTKWYNTVLHDIGVAWGGMPLPKFLATLSFCALRGSVPSKMLLLA